MSDVRSPGRPRRPETACDLVDAAGFEALTLSAVAARLDVRPPSLYNHVDGLDDLRDAVRVAALEGLGAVIRDAAVGRSGADALRALAHAYRRWVRAHPGQYALTQSGIEDAPSEEVRAAGRAVVEVVLATLRGFGLEGDEAIHAARALRSALHGFVLLETGAGFGMPIDVDASFDRVVEMIVEGVRARPG